MFTRIALVLCSAALLVSVGCDKEENKEGEGGSKTGTTAEANSGKLTLRPPTAKDLKRYTKNLKGEGPLVATIETSEGTLHCELFEQGAPLTVANFVGLASGQHAFRDPKTGKTVKRPFYDGLTFHRVMPGFMVQGGDPQGNGRGGPGYKFATEVSRNLKHDKAGILSMANGGKNTNGSQFFIMDGARASLDGGYNVFGHCKETDVVKKIAGVPKKPGGEGSTPVQAPTIDKVTITRGMPN